MNTQAQLLPTWPAYGTSQLPAQSTAGLDLLAPDAFQPPSLLDHITDRGQVTHYRTMRDVERISEQVRHVALTTMGEMVHMDHLAQQVTYLLGAQAALYRDDPVCGHVHAARTARTLRRMDDLTDRLYDFSLSLKLSTVERRWRP